MRASLATSVLYLAMFALGGCYATTSAAVDPASALRRGAQRREIVVAGGPLGAHVGPSSWLRFTLRDGARTPWLVAGRLRVNDARVDTTGALAHPTDAPPANTSVAWADVASVEVNELNMPETFAGVAAGTVVVTTAAVVEVALLAIVSSASCGHVNGDLGLTRGAFEAVAGEAFQRPDDEETAPPPSIPTLEANEDPPRPLFASEARRREVALFTFSTEAGVDAGLGPGAVGGVAAGVRLAHVFDVQLGARTSLTPTSNSPTTPALVRSLPFVRLGLHLDLDAGRRVALAVGGDLAMSSDETRLRLLYGVRVRATDHLQIGLYPWNPVAVSTTAAPSPGPSRLNLVELTWLF
ncbi:MAG TPA: hypothetical protein VHJ20_20325 [Polyangia bacterium]|nr:hypothetical protein [Polyangia bacterium]